MSNTSTPSKKTFRSRVGAAVRRSSSFSPSRPGTPSRMSSQSSLRVDSTASLLPAATLSDHPSPSPIAESPVVEPGATITDKPALSASPMNTSFPEPVKAAETPAVDPATPSSPPEISLVSPSPGAEPEAVIYTSEPEPLKDDPARKPATVDQAVTPKASPLSVPDVVEASSDGGLATGINPALPAVVPVPTSAESTAKPTPRTIPAELQPESDLTSSDSTPRQLEKPAEFEFFPVGQVSKVTLETTAPAYESSQDPAAPGATVVVAAPVDKRREESSASSSSYGYAHSNHSRVSVGVVPTNPFADSAGQSMPAPSVEAPWTANAGPWDAPQANQQPLSENPYDTVPVNVPLPPLHDVISNSSSSNVPYNTHLPRGAVRTNTLNIPYNYSVGSTIAHTEEDETRPLLPRPVTPDTYSKARGGRRNVPWPVPVPTLETLGWTEYVLPDTTFYYTHREMRVTTDVDLRNSKKLEAVTHYLDRRMPEELQGRLPDRWELWLRDSGASKNEFLAVRNWVNHGARTVSFEPPPTRSAEASLPDDVTDDDRLDMEFRFWSFMETHPAHAPLPENSHTEALDSLTWSYTDSVLPSSRPISGPFTPEECQELMRLLHSLSASASSPRFHTIVHTRIIARILLRVAQWRQATFRPGKALPRDISPDRRVPFLRAVFNFIMSCLCLGIPYLFFDRNNGRRIDEEGGLNSTGSVFALGASGCIVAAVILSASVTFLSLPGLDDIARVAGLVAILCSTASMISSVIALFRHKADVQRVVSCVRGEGLMVVSRRSILLSLPLVFLAWSVAALVTGITLYAFRGVAFTNPLPVDDFHALTRWTVVGVLGGLAGVLVMSALFAR